MSECEQQEPEPEPYPWDEDEQSANAENFYYSWDLFNSQNGLEPDDYENYEWDIIEEAAEGDF
jgi:hypothetical protein